MKSKTTWISGITILSLVVPFLAFAEPVALRIAGPTENTNTLFTDVPSNHPFFSTLTTVKEKGFMRGYADGSFSPEQSINRAEFLKTLVSAITTTPKGSNCFSDVKDEWFAPYVCEAKARGIVKGYSDNTFRPSNNVSFVEAAQMMTHANIGISAGVPTGRDAWFTPAVNTMEQKRAIPVTIDTLDQKISRSDAAEMIYRVKERVENKTSKTLAALSNPLPVINSCDELNEKLKIFDYRQYGGQRMYKDAMPLMMPTSAPAAQNVGAAPVAESARDSEESADSSSSFSTTNVQVEGVDEADIVKNDANYIYILSGRKVRIVKAAPVGEMKEVGVVVLEEKNITPQDMYVDGNKLVIVGTSYEYMNADGGDAIRPMMYPWRDSTRTIVSVVNITDRAAPKVERTVKFDGNILSTRKIDNQLYVVTNTYNGYHVMYDQEATDKPEQVVPYVFDSKVGAERPLVNCNQVRFVPNYEDVNFLTVASLDVSNPNSTLQKQVIMGSGENIYASRESLYVAATRYSYPLMGTFNIWNPPMSTEETRLVRFALGANGAVTYSSTGTVPGHLLNQFSMDENGNYFRVATTIGQVWAGLESSRASRNSLYVLDRSDLSKRVGALENLAPGETIYSVRFMGNRAYMVTFKKIDPFFVLDVSEPTNPKVLGELKIPGYSDYLHPYDENHVIGFGKDAVDPREIEETNPGPWSLQFTKDFAWYQGMKIALFDVTDVANPKLQFNEVIGDRGTNSELLHNHKALLYDRARGIFAFPVTVARVTDEDRARSIENMSDPGSAYGKDIFQGAYIYHLDLTKGFTLLGKVSHLPANTFTQPNVYINEEMPGVIRRIVLINDYLYTVSRNLVKAFALPTGNGTINVDAPSASAAVQVDPEDTPVPVPYLK
ncbi:beta-propeller domain-containing protein [Candidatus Gracilibacteria bacterium]|nr:beta-propeller domain-containing protein [Candidatus Gracilibacteria bacterium]